MMRLRSAFVAFFALAAFSATAANLPCEPTPACALQIARDLAMKSLRAADSDDDVIYVVGVLEWAQGLGPESDAVVRARFADLSKRIAKMADVQDRELANRWLGIFMANSGFMPEASKLADKIDNDGRNVIYANIAEEHARHGRWREAFKAVNEIHDEEPGAASQFFALRNALKSVARTGQPALIEEGVRMAEDAPIGFLQTGLAWSDLYAGKDDAAIQRAMQQTDIDMRMTVLMELQNWYQDEKRDPGVLRVERLQLDVLREMKHVVPMRDVSDMEDHLSQRYFEGLVKAGRHSEALAWAPQVPADDRGMKLTSLFFDLREPGDIAEAARLGSLISEKYRERANNALTWARIASGLVEPSAGIASVAKPGEFARHVIELLRDLDPALADRARAILAAAIAADKASPDKGFSAGLFYNSALVRAQIKYGLLEDARKTIDDIKYPDDRVPWLLALSVAQSRAGQAEVARATKAEGMALLPRLESNDQPDNRADILVRAELYEDAETELRRLMVPDPLPPPFTRVAQPLIQEFLKSGETRRAFQLAFDWSALFGDPEAIAACYSAATSSKQPPANLGRMLKRFR